MKLTEKLMSAQEAQLTKPYIKQLLTSIEERVPVLMRDGNSYLLIKTKEVMELAQSKDPLSLLKIGSQFVPFFQDKDGKIFKWSDIEKSPFSGKTLADAIAKENIALSGLDTELRKAQLAEQSETIHLKVGNHVYQVAGIESTPGTPKSDFHFIDQSGKEVVWISHKDGSKATHFGQWGGVSPSAEPKIATHPEVQSFAEALIAKVGTEMPKGITFGRKISDNKIKQMSVFGNMFGGAFGRQNVQVALQGDPKLVKAGGVYTLDAVHVLLNGQPITGDYDPILIARYASDRTNFKIRFCRASVYPIGGRKITEWI